MKDAPGPDHDPLADRFGPLARHLFEEAPLAAIWRLSFLANFYTGPLYARLQAKHRLGRPGFVVLLLPVRARRPHGARRCAGVQGLPKNSVSRAAADLIAKGLVVADADGGDRRAKPMRLTDRGTALMAELLPAFGARQEDLTHPLSAAERETFRLLLEKMAGHLPNWVDRIDA